MSGTESFIVWVYADTFGFAKFIVLVWLQFKLLALPNIVLAGVSYLLSFSSRSSRVCHFYSGNSYAEKSIQSGVYD